MLSVKRFTIVMCPTNGMTLSTKILIAEEHFLMAQGLRKFWKTGATYLVPSPVSSPT
jgi:hypothetical protein